MFYRETGVFRESYAAGDTEELEYAAMREAGRASLRLVGSDRRVYRVEDLPRIRQAIANRRGPGRPRPHERAADHEGA